MQPSVPAGGTASIAALMCLEPQHRDPWAWPTNGTTQLRGPQSLHRSGCESDRLRSGRWFSGRSQRQQQRDSEELSCAADPHRRVGNSPTQPVRELRCHLALHSVLQGECPRQVGPGRLGTPPCEYCSRGCTRSRGCTPVAGPAPASPSPVVVQGRGMMSEKTAAVMPPMNPRRPGGGGLSGKQRLHCGAARSDG